MKKSKVIIGVIFLFFLSFSSSSFAQSRQEQKYINYLTDLIKDQEEVIEKMEKDLEKEKRSQVESLEREKRVWLKKSNPKKAGGFDDVAEATKKISEIDSALADARVIYSSLPLDQARERLDQLKQQRLDYEAQWIKPEDGYIPQEMSSRKKNRWNNSNEVERSELVLKKVKNNLSGESFDKVEVISFKDSKPNAYYITDFDKIDDYPMETEWGLKVVVHNRHYLSTTFRFQPLNGGDRKSIELPEGAIVVCYLIPGDYIVKTIVGSRPTRTDSKLTIDGQSQAYGIINPFTDEVKMIDCYAYTKQPEPH